MDMAYFPVIVAVLLTIPVGWLFILIRAINARVDTMQKTYYDKAETKEMIKLHNAPLVQMIQQVKQDTAEIKVLIGKIYDDQQKAS